MLISFKQIDRVGRQWKHRLIHVGPCDDRDDRDAVRDAVRDDHDDRDDRDAVHDAVRDAVRNDRDDRDVFFVFFLLLNHFWITFLICFGGC
jgi:hypothetical protein